MLARPRPLGYGREGNAGCAVELAMAKVRGYVVEGEVYRGFALQCFAECAVGENGSERRMDNGDRSANY